MREANTKSFARFWHTALAAVLGLIVVGASAGSINYAIDGNGWLYAFVGILNLGWLYPLIRQAVIYNRNNE
jgi:hypothetical protein